MYYVYRDLTKATSKKNATMNWQLPSFHLDAMICQSLYHHGIHFAYPNKCFHGFQNQKLHHKEDSMFHMLADLFQPKWREA